MDKKIETALKNLEANNFKAEFAEDSRAAKEIVLRLIGENKVVGVADSTTLRQIGIVEKLENRGIKVLNPFSRELTTDITKTATRDDLSRQIFQSDAFISGSNSVTRDGKLVNIDAVGNRVASMIFGPKKIVIVVGRNKLVKNVDEALHRIKNVIAPFHARTKKFATPCAQTGKCSDCNAPKRICNVIAILEKKPWRTDITVVMVNEDLGLGWDETWPSERIREIKKKYESATWIFAGSKAA